MVLSSTTMAAHARLATPLSSPVPLLGVTPDSMIPLIGGKGRAQMVWDMLRTGADPFAAEAPVGKKLRAALEAHFTGLDYHVSQTKVSSCGTRKLLIDLPAGDAVETVIIPEVDRSYSTLCVSSQVGCRQACSFCATGTMGLLRSLRMEEILTQVHAAQAASAASGMPPIRNLVFMGMGEPADNLAAVAPALNAMTHPFGFRLAKRHLCVSTVGPSPQAIRALRPLPCRLAWSVHAADDGLRKLLVPTTRHTMAQLRDAFAETLAARKDRGLMAEVTLIDGVNDGLDDAAKLDELLKPLPGKTRINLIPYNANAGLGAAGKLFEPSPPESVRAFQNELVTRGVITTVRTTRGDDEASACGQLIVGSKKR